MINCTKKSDKSPKKVILNSFSKTWKNWKVFTNNTKKISKKSSSFITSFFQELSSKTRLSYTKMTCICPSERLFSQNSQKIVLPTKLTRCNQVLPENKFVRALLLVNPILIHLIHKKFIFESKLTLKIATKWTVPFKNSFKMPKNQSFNLHYLRIC